MFPCMSYLESLTHSSTFRPSTFLSALLLISVPSQLSASILSESWAMLSRGASQPRCVDIPANFSLCTGLEYTRMRLPNLLEHETMTEALEQASSWVPLLRLNCHPDAQLFLCSLFAPVCLARHDPVKPCRSLCGAVQAGCEARMRYHGFPWPEMLRCDKFPTHDMCVPPRATAGKSVEDSKCAACKQVGTVENMLDTFCRSTHVMRVNVKQAKPRFLKVKVQKILKPKGQERPRASQQIFYNEDGDQRCPCDVVKHGNNGRGSRKQRYLVMANRNESSGKFVMNLVLPWKKERSFKRVVRMFRKLNCQQLGDQIRNRARRERARRYRQQVIERRAHHQGIVEQQQQQQQQQQRRRKHRQQKQKRRQQQRQQRRRQRTSRSHSDEIVDTFLAYNSTS